MRSRQESSPWLEEEEVGFLEGGDGAAAEVVRGGAGGGGQGPGAGDIKKIYHVCTSI